MAKRQVFALSSNKLRDSNGYTSDAGGQTIRAGASIIALNDGAFDRIVWQRNWDSKFEVDNNADRIIQFEQEVGEAFWQSKVSTVANSTGILVLYQSKMDQARISYRQIDLGSPTGNVIEGS